MLVCFTPATRVASAPHPMVGIERPRDFAARSALGGVSLRRETKAGGGSSLRVAPCGYKGRDFRVVSGGGSY